VRTSYRGYEITELPPNTQGSAALATTAPPAHPALGARGHGGAGYHHLMVEAIKLAFEDRDRW
jgi:gamma-glutamyltranspeptidase/glutathione hydrolase